jgi:hypothetical protein
MKANELLKKLGSKLLGKKGNTPAVFKPRWMGKRRRSDSWTDWASFNCIRSGATKPGLC